MQPQHTQHLHITADSSGQRLDNYLIRQLKGVPKSHIYRIIRSGEVRINKGRCRADSRIQTGDIIRIPPIQLSQPSHQQHPAHTPHIPDRAFDILLEDAHVLAIHKPAGVAVHGGSGVSFGVIEQLRSTRANATFLELVHRLDRETSGILLVAKKRSALLDLQNQFRQRSPEKTYLALVCGTWPRHITRIHTPLRKELLFSPQYPQGQRHVRPTHADDPQGMPALSLVRVVQHLEHPAGPMSLLVVTIKTGRTHQIRVHLAHSGYPIAGDEKYGKFSLNRTLAQKGLKRMFLHAWRLRFQHPASGERIALEQPLEPALENFLHSCQTATQPPLP